MAIDNFQQHGETAKAALLEQFKGKANVEALLDAISTQFNDLDAALVDLVTERSIDTAIGAQLDQLADVVDILRGDDSDSELRARIKAEVRLNRSEGTIEDVLAVLALVLGSSASITLAEFAPAAFTVTVINTLLSAVIADLIKRTRAGGVSAQLIYTEVADSAAFFFASADAEVASSTQGWADDAQTTGGAFADVKEA